MAELGAASIPKVLLGQGMCVCTPAGQMWAAWKRTNVGHLRLAQGVFSRTCTSDLQCWVTSRKLRASGGRHHPWETPVDGGKDGMGGRRHRMIHSEECPEKSNLLSQCPAPQRLKWGALLLLCLPSLTPTALNLNKQRGLPSPMLASHPQQAEKLPFQMISHFDYNVELVICISETVLLLK